MLLIIPRLAPPLFVIPLFSLCLNFNSNDRSEAFQVPEYTRLLVDNLQQEAIIISAQWDYWCSAFWYKQRVEDYRRDVVLIEKELLRRTWYLDQLQKWYPHVTGPCKQEIEEFLTHLAVDLRVASSTQNQAFNALLFLYREVLGIDIDEQINAVRAKKPRKLPTVMTKGETFNLIENLDGIHQLMSKLLYGSGLRLMECVRLRIKDVDFEYQQII